MLQVIGADRLPRLSDLDSLPFLRAVMMESNRRTVPVPFGVPYYCTRDTAVNDGSVIPKGCLILGNLHQIMNDPAAFPEPHEFKPERFLDDGGRFVSDERASVAFGVGKHFCPGRELAEAQCFLFLAGLLQRFTFEFHAASPATEVDEYGGQGITKPVPNYMVLFKPRFK